MVRLGLGSEQQARYDENVNTWTEYERQAFREPDDNHNNEEENS